MALKIFYQSWLELPVLYTKKGITTKNVMNLPGFRDQAWYKTDEQLMGICQVYRSQYRIFVSQVFRGTSRLVCYIKKAEIK